MERITTKVLTYLLVLNLNTLEAHRK